MPVEHSFQDGNAHVPHADKSDFFCSRVRLAIELDGGVHENTRDYDARRDEILTSMDIEVLRIQNEELIDMESVLQKIHERISVHSK